jgi:hypothetical protein
MTLHRWISLFCLLFIFTGILPPTDAQEEGEKEPQLIPQVLDVFPFPGTEMSRQAPLLITFNQAMDARSVQKPIGEKKLILWIT